MITITITITITIMITITISITKYGDYDVHHPLCTLLETGEG